VCVCCQIYAGTRLQTCLEQQGVPVSVTAARHCTEGYDKHTSCVPAHMALLSCALPQDLCYQLMKVVSGAAESLGTGAPAQARKE
jgi:hypothetical protein